MDEEIDITNPDFWGEWDAACWKAFEALHNNTKIIGDNARMYARKHPTGDQTGEQAA
jgi:hypothetical protein